MDGNLIELSADSLLQKFGAGDHKPGSGSAAALQGMLSAQLLRTVINLTCEEKRIPNYRESLSELRKIESEIESRIYPELQRLFQEDSEQFDKTIKLRKIRDAETNPVLKSELEIQALNELQISTETPIRIAELCAELATFGAFIFDNGFRSARGDASVAQNGAIAAVAGCISIVDLNLLSFKTSDWVDKIRKKRDDLRYTYDRLSEESISRLDELKKEFDAKASLQSELDLFLSNQEARSNLTYLDIENTARDLQNILWKFKDDIWKKIIPATPLEVLKPEVALKKVLGYQFNRPDTLGQYEVNGSMFEIAGIIDRNKKTVNISRRFPLETQNFTAAHELGHALFHKGTVLHRDRALDGTILQKDIKELQADKFASYFLMPKKQIENTFKELFGIDTFIITEHNVFALDGSTINSFMKRCSTLRDLSRIVAASGSFAGRPSMAEIFQVSIETMAIRLEELEMVEF